MRPLSADQRAAVAKFSRLKVGALFMACGTGKTQTATAIVNTIPDLQCLIWFCPCRCKDNTRDELAKCGLNYTPHIFGIESMSASPTAFDEVKAILAAHPREKSCIVLDESLTIKNIKSKRTRRLLELSEMADYKFILNGTPVTKNILDIYSQMDFLSPLILSCSLTAFKDRYLIYNVIKTGNRMVEKPIGAANIEHLKSIIAPYTYECNLELDFGKDYYTHECRLSRDEMDEYKDRKAELIMEYKRGTETNMGAVFAKLLHSYCLAPVKIHALRRLLTDDAGNDLTPRTLVFCRFQKSFDHISALFPGLRILTYGKGAIGLNLQQYSRIIYYDKTYDYAQREQSEARIFRRGQTCNCEYHDITLNTGIDRLIDNCIATKQNLLDVFMNRAEELDKLED